MSCSVQLKNIKNILDNGHRILYFNIQKQRKIAMRCPTSTVLVESTPKVRSDKIAQIDQNMPNFRVHWLKKNYITAGGGDADYYELCTLINISKTLVG